jgi:hypothetical protein
MRWLLVLRGRWAVTLWLRPEPHTMRDAVFVCTTVCIKSQSGEVPQDRPQTGVANADLLVHHQKGRSVATSPRLTEPGWLVEQQQPRCAPR